VENGWGKHDLKVLLDAHTLEWKLLGNWQGPNVDLNQKDQVLNFLNQVQAAQLQAISEATNLPKRSLYEVLKRLQADGLIEKRGDRQAAIYARKGIQQIQLLNSLLN
jgi:DNA-binding transcriptional ArsR family regulator